MPSIKKRISTYDHVIHNGQIFAVSKIITDQKNLGNNRYVKPEITVYKIHHGKILVNTDRFIGEDYEVVV